MSADKPQKPGDTNPGPRGNDAMQSEVQAQQRTDLTTKVLDPAQMLNAPKLEVIPKDLGGVQNSDQPLASAPIIRPGNNQTALTPIGSEQVVGAPQPVLRAGSDQGLLGAPAGRLVMPDGPARVVPLNSEHQTPGSLGAATPAGSEVKPAVVSRTRSSEAGAYQSGDASSSPVLKVGDSGIKSPVELPAAPSPTKSGVFTFTTNENNQVTVTRLPQKAQEVVPSVQSPSSERSLPSPNLSQDGGQQKLLVAPETQLRSNPLGEQAGGQNQTRTVTPERVDVSANALKGNTGPSVETANFTRPNLGSLENQNQVKPNSASPDAQTRTVPGVSPDAGSRDLSGRDGLTRTNVSGNAVDAQGRQIPVAGAEKLPLGLDNKQAPADAASARVGGPQASLDVQGKQTAGSAPSDTFGTRREAGLQLPDTKQTSGRTDSGVQLPDTKQSSGRTDTGGTKLPDPRNDTGRNDANTGKLPDAKTLANLDQKFGDKVNPPGKGGGVPIAIPGIPDILGGLRGDKDSKTGKDAKGDPQGTKEGSVKSEAPGGRDSKDAKGESQGSKDSKIIDGKGDTRSGADDKSVAGQKGVRAESDSTTKSPDGRAVQDVRNTSQDGKTGADGRSVDGRGQGGSNLVHDGGSKPDGAKSDVSHGGRADGADKGTERVPGAGEKGVGDKGHTDVGAGGKAVGSRGDGPFVLPPGSLPVPDLVGGIKNISQQIDARTGKTIPADAGKTDATKGDASKVDPGNTKGTIGDGVKTIVTGGVTAGDGVKHVVTGGAKGADGVKVVGANDASIDGKQTAGKNPVGTRLDGVIIVPPGAVPLSEMIGNLKGIAARIFPPESRAGRPDAFDNFLPGRKTERLEDRTQSTLGSGVRAESTIPIVRAIGERVGKTDEQFVIKAPQSVVDVNKANQSKIEAVVATPPWIVPEHAVSDKSPPGLKAAVDASAAKPTDAKSVKNDVQAHVAKAGEHHVPHADKHDQVVHDEAAERLLVNLELVGAVESAPAVESEEEEVFPLAAIEYFGGEFEKAISNEEDVMFDGDGTVAEDDEQSTRYQYIVEAGDTVELIAIKVFKNVTLAPLIYEINKDEIPIGMQDGRMVFTLKVGTVIWLPFPKEIKAYMGT